MNYPLVALLLCSLISFTCAVENQDSHSTANLARSRQNPRTVQSTGSVQKAANHSSHSAPASGTRVPGTGLIPPQGDHPDWAYRNGEYIPDQQDHFRFHCYLAMAAYGNYAELCPKTFTRGFKVLQVFSSGFIARVDEMRKIVIVFKGFDNYADIDLTPASVSTFVVNCPECMVAAGVRDRYMELRRETNDFQVAKNAVTESIQNGVPQMLFSVTGLGWGGALAALCGLHLGSQNWVHYSHNSGMPRFMNDAAVIKYDNLFQLLAGQSVVSKNDYAVGFVPKGVYSHVGQKVRIHGDKSQWYVNCFGNNENSTCLGDASSRDDHFFYFTPIGACGSADKGF